MTSQASYFGSRFLTYMVESGIVAEMDSGKLRWWSTLDSSKSSNYVPITDTGAAVTALALDTRASLLCFSRRGLGVFALKLKGGNKKEVKLPIDKTNLSGNITALHIKEDGDVLTIFAGDDQGVLVKWDFRGKKPSPPQQIQKGLDTITSIYGINNDLYIAVNDGIKLVKIDPTNGVTMQEWPVVATPPISRILALDSIGQILVASQHRHTSLFSMESDEAQYLVSDAPPIFVDCSPYYWDKENVHILGLSENNEVSVWKVSGKKSEKPINPSLRIKLDPSSTKGHMILGARFISNNQIRIACGSYLKPQFIEYTYHKNGKFVQEEHFIKSIKKGVLPTDENQALEQEKKDNNVRLLGPMESKIPLPQHKDSSMELESDDNKDNVPFSQLLKSQDKKDKRSKKKDTNPKASSAVTALSAALAANDREMINDILGKTDERFVIATIKQLSASNVLPLLSELLLGFTKKPTLSNIIWTKHLLMIHQGHLSSSPDLIDRLSGLYNSIDERLQYFPDLLKLNGRLDLLLSYSRDMDEVKVAEGKAMQTYDEDDFDDEE